MTTTELTRASETSSRRDFPAARSYLPGRRGLIAAGAVIIAAGVAFKWSWLVAAGIAPVLLSVLPCVAMCALGLCMNRMMGGSSGSQQSETHNAPEETGPPQLAASPDETGRTQLVAPASAGPRQPGNESCCQSDR